MKRSEGYQIGPDTKMVIMLWARDAKGGDPHNKKQTEYEVDGNETQRTSKDEMGKQTEE